MRTDNDIEAIYEELTKRYDRISMATIKDVLRGRRRVSAGQITLATASDGTPSLVEVQLAFLKHTCVIFTAFRGGFTLEQNQARNAKLKADMDALGATVSPGDGVLS